MHTIKTTGGPRLWPKETSDDSRKINFIPQDPVTLDLLVKVLAEMCKCYLQSQESHMEDDQHSQSDLEQDPQTEYKITMVRSPNISEEERSRRINEAFDVLLNFGTDKSRPEKPQGRTPKEQITKQPTMKSTVRSKAGRLALLLRLRDAGVLEDRTLQEIGDVLGVDQSTVSRDLCVLDEVEIEYQRLMAQQAWPRRYYTVAEFAQEIAASPETVRHMVRDGLVKAHDRHDGRGSGKDERWYIPISELDRFGRGEG